MVAAPPRRTALGVVRHDVQGVVRWQRDGDGREWDGRRAGGRRQGTGTHGGAYGVCDGGGLVFVRR